MTNVFAVPHIGELFHVLKGKDGISVSASASMCSTLVRGVKNTWMAQPKKKKCSCSLLYFQHAVGISALTRKGNGKSDAAKWTLCSPLTPPKKKRKREEEQEKRARKKKQGKWTENQGEHRQKSSSQLRSCCNIIRFRRSCRECSHHSLESFSV